MSVLIVKLCVSFADMLRMLPFVSSINCVVLIYALIFPYYNCIFEFVHMLTMH